MASWGKGNKLYSIAAIRCPRCNETGLFETGSFSFRKSFEMKDRCEVCDLNFLPEPGYYVGAMFISYIFTGFFCLAFVFFLHWVLGWSTAASFAALFVVLGVGFVYIFRLARSIWINLNVGYDPRAAKR